MLDTLKKVIGCILLFGSIALGIYIGFWLMFIGGIVQIINSVTPEVSALGIALGFLRFSFASVVGYSTAVISALIGKLLLE